MNIALSVVGALIFIGAGYAVLRKLRAIRDTNRSDTYFSCMWLWFGAWVGLILVVPNTFDLVTGGATPPPSWIAVVVVLVFVVPFAGFGIAGLWSRWGQFRDLRRQCVEMGTTPPRYFWKPWAITGWTLTFGYAAIIAAAFGVGALLDNHLEGASSLESENANRVFSNVLFGCLVGLMVLAALAGLWRWRQLRVEAREHLQEARERLTQG